MARGKSVKKHPERVTIDKLLLTGWSPSKIYDWLVSSKKVVISAQTILHYCTNYINPKMILPPSIYHQKVNQLDVQIDSLQELYNFIEIQKRRLGYLLKEEDDLQTILPETRKELELLKDTIIKIVELEMELGIRSKRPIEIMERRLDVNELVSQFLIAKQEHGWVIPDP